MLFRRLVVGLPVAVAPSLRHPLAGSLPSVLHDSPACGLPRQLAVGEVCAISPLVDVVRAVYGSEHDKDPGASPLPPAIAWNLCSIDSRTELGA